MDYENNWFPLNTERGTLQDRLINCVFEMVDRKDRLNQYTLNVHNKIICITPHILTRGDMSGAKFIYSKTYRDLLNFIEPFYKKSGEAHSIDHAKDVSILAAVMNVKFNLWDNQMEVIVAGLTHDIAKWQGAKDHHTNGVILLQESDVFNELCSKYNLNKEAILAAVGEHRASFKGEFTTELSKLISAADRGYPNVKRIVARIKRIGFTREEGIFRIQNKYVGYANYPQIYKDYFGDSFIEFQRQCNDIGLLNSLWDVL